MQQTEARHEFAAAATQRGFTLVELLVALAIAAILAAIAYPSYSGAVRRTRRSEGKTALLQLMQQEERYYSQHNSYVGFSAASTDADEKLFKWYSGDSPAASNYEIDGAPCASGESLQECVMLRARPGTAKVDGSFKDTECGTLTLTSTGVKGAGASDCWS